MSKLLKVILAVILILLFLFESQINAQEVSLPEMPCKQYNQLSEHQQVVLKHVHYYGEPYDLGYTMSAIAWNESNAGQWRLNYHSNDFGLMQINITTASSILGMTNHYKKLELSQRLIYDDELSMYLSLQVLKHFGKNMTWRDMIKSYNKGYSWQSDPDKNIIANKYLKSVIEKVNILKQCMYLKEI